MEHRLKLTSGRDACQRITYATLPATLKHTCKGMYIWLYVCMYVCVHVRMYG